MKKRDQIILINQVCDVFEAELRFGRDADIDAVLNSETVQNRCLEFVDVLLAELIVLQIVYSKDCQATADFLRSKFPDQIDEIESAIQQRE